MRRVLVSLVVTAVTLSGCVALSVNGSSDRGHGPPPHAPAHGYRHHHQGAKLAFDSKLGVFVVVGYPDYFYSDGQFLRLDAGSWQVSASLPGPWRPYPSGSVPPGLRSAHPSNAKRGKRKEQLPAKGRW
jgi:hypothetical protein